MDSVSDYDKFESLAEGALSVLRASQVNVKTTDIYRNTHTRRLHSHTSVVGSGLSEVSPKIAGAVSGFTHGAAELPELVIMVLKSPKDTWDALTGFLASVDREWLMDVIPLMVQSVQDQQALDNPFDPNEKPDKYETYKDWWYTGYAIHFVVSLVFGGKWVKTVSDISGLSRKLSTAAGKVDDIKPLAKSGAARKTTGIARV